MLSITNNLQIVFIFIVKALIQEWAKYRYGVFDESGFVGDDLYPACYTIPGSEEVRATDCTNKEIGYDFR